MLKAHTYILGQQPSAKMLSCNLDPITQHHTYQIKCKTEWM